MKDIIAILALAALVLGLGMFGLTVIAVWARWMCDSGLLAAGSCA